jgi:hypothetical protein
MKRIAATAIVLMAAPCFAACQPLTGNEPPLDDPPRLSVIVSTIQPMNLMIDAEKDLRESVERMTQEIGFVSEPMPANPVRAVPVLPSTRRSRPDASTSGRIGGSIGTHEAAGTIPRTLVEQLVDKARFPRELATQRVRDHLLAIEVGRYGVTLESVERRPVMPLVYLSIEMADRTPTAITALEREIHGRMARWERVLYASRPNPGRFAIQLSLQIDPLDCDAVEAQLREEFGRRITRAECAR